MQSVGAFAILCVRPFDRVRLRLLFNNLLFRLFRRHLPDHVESEDMMEEEDRVVGVLHIWEC